MAEHLKLPDALVWLADAPMFIDGDQVSRFFDAVASPEHEVEKVIQDMSKEHMEKVTKKLGIGVEVEPGALVDVISSIFTFIKPKGSISAEQTKEKSDSEKKSASVELRKINTPQRQLVQLALHYLVSHQDRLFFVDDPTNKDWRDVKTISEVPRELVFLDLPGLQKAKSTNLPTAKLIPLAVEFESGVVELIYKNFRSEDGCPPPKYKDPSEVEDDDSAIREAHKSYWSWFDEYFSASKAMVMLEESGAKNGKINWIDYRIPITNEGDTLHLHMSPLGKYNTGTFAYKTIKRGFRHGLRLVGTLKSGPAMNVLAIYEK